MTESSILFVLLIILSADFLLERILGFLNRKSSKQPIPKELTGIYDDEKYEKSQAYQHALGRFGNFSATFSFLLTFSAIYFGWFGLLDSWMRTFSPLDMLTTLMFFGVIFIISDLIGTPFSLYQTFVIEERFGFNKTSFKTFILDKLKGYVLTIIIGGVLMLVLLYLIASMGSDFWLIFWGVIVVFTLLMNMFYTSWILPLFNKLTPMEEGSLKEKIEAFSQKVSFPLTNIFVIDGSKRSAKGNAFFSGLGRKKKVVLYDTLIEKHTEDELTAIFAHEVGHYKKRHIYLTTVISMLQIGFTLYLLSLMLFSSEVSYAMGGNMTAIHLNILAFGILYTPVSHVLGLLMNLLSRKHEYEADAYAAEHYDSQPLIDGLKRLSGEHLSNLTPHPAYVFVHYSHPSLLQRVRAIGKLASN
ncbi:MAG: M48 family metallopeptidase [Cyclobacteriaceae bacterium]